MVRLPMAAKNPEYLIPGLAALAHIGIAGRGLVKIGPVQYYSHKMYAVLEPAILRILDFIIAGRFMRETAAGRLLLKGIVMAGRLFPHGVVLATARAKEYVDLVERAEGPKGGRLAGGLLYPGPEQVSVSLRKCLGREECGACIFGGAVFIGSWPAVDESKCQGCGRCARVCRGKARRMTPSPGFRRGDIFPVNRQGSGA